MRNATLFPALERALGPGALGALGEAFKKATEAKANGTERGVGPLVPSSARRLKVAPLSQ
jgi:hypothetical protein